MMIKKLLILLTITLMTGCSNLKNTKRYLASGNYDTAINTSLRYLQKNRFGRKAADYNALLFESYVKAVNKDKRSLDFYKQDNNPESLEAMYNTYNRLENRQNKIRPLLPIEGYHFKLEDYSFVKLSTRNKLSDYLYNKAKTLTESNDKNFVRKGHDDLKYIQEINTNFRDVPVLIEQSRAKGMDYVLINFQNNTEQIIPQRLAVDLLNLDQYNLNNYWTIHHSSFDKNTTYDYEMVLSFEDIKLSPERVTEVFINQEKEIIDGKEYVLDANGNVKKDGKGNDIKVDRKIKVNSIVHQRTQEKNCQIKALAQFIRFDNKQILSAIPFTSQFVFEHRYATFSGDRRSIVQQYLDLLNNQQVQFPSDEQMILDTGDDIKRQLQNILTKQNF